MATINSISGGAKWTYKDGYTQHYSISVCNSGFGKEGTCTIPAGRHLAIIWVHQQCDHIATTDGDCIWTITPTNCTITKMMNKIWTGNSNSDAWYRNMQVFMYHVYIPGNDGASIHFKHRAGGNYSGSVANVYLFNEI